MLDFTVQESSLGKPAGADLKLGLSTAPVLFAWEENEAMGPLIARRFEGDGDVEMVGGSSFRARPILTTFKGTRYRPQIERVGTNPSSRHDIRRQSARSATTVT